MRCSARSLAWRVTAGRVAFENIHHVRDELFYWVTILISNTLGTALGDYVADDAGFGFQRGALLFAVILGVIALAYFFTPISKSWLFWAAYVLTRPLGATVGDTLTKPHREGGFALSRIASSAVIALLMIRSLTQPSRKRTKRAWTSQVRSNNSSFIIKPCEQLIFRGR